MNDNLGNIPADIRWQPMWLQYYLSPDAKKPDKKPRKHPCVKYATAEDRVANLRSLDYLIENREAPKNGGGYQRYVDKAEGFTYVDIDKARNPETGEVEPWAEELIEWLDTYCEVSASGTGFHIVARGTLPEDFHVDPNQVEIYCGNIPNKLLALTGDVFEFHHNVEERQSKLAHLLVRAKRGEFNKTSPAAGDAAALPPAYTVQWMSEIVPKPITWFWPGRIPRGKITVFAGQPGTGKSLISVALAALATTGRPFPDENSDVQRAPENVLMFFCEDDAEDTVVPRLKVAGADVSRVARIKVPDVSGASKEEREFAFDTDRKILVDFLDKHPDVKLVIVDPISNYTGKIKSNDEQQLRSVLVPLAGIAAERGVTLVFIAHFNKRADVETLGKVMGAVAMTGVARSAWLFIEDKDAPEGQERYLMLEGKSNLARKQKGLEYTIVAKPFFPPPAQEVPLIEWGKVTDVKASDRIGAVNAFDDEGTKLKAAEEWLGGFLAGGRKPQAEVRKAMSETISWRTMETAKKNLGVISKPTGGCWYWSLPDKPLPEGQETPQLDAF